MTKLKIKGDNKMKRKLILGISIISLILLPLSVSAYVFTDEYWGGDVVNAGATAYGDEISGSLNEFSVDTFEAVEFYNGHEQCYSFKLTGDYFSNYSNDIGLAREYAPGDLYISTSGWHVNSTSDNYAYDTFDANEGWDYVITFNSSGIYELDYNSITMSSAPSGYVYRSDQAWRDGYGTYVGVSTTYINTTAGTLEFVFPTRLLTLDLENIGYHWTMRCGNDVVEGGGTPVPEPTTLLLLGFGLFGLGLVRRKS